MRILSVSVNHDSSICSLKDGEIEFFCKEERLSKIKRDSNSYCSLDLYKNLNFGKIDKIVFCSSAYGQTEEFVAEKLYLKQITRLFETEEIEFLKYPHHACHAELAYVNSGFEQALVFVIDRNGSFFYDARLFGNELVARESETVFIFDRNNGKREIQKNFWKVTNKFNKNEVRKAIQQKYPNTLILLENPYSIVKVYEAATTLIGQDILENGKTMGLSSYGEDLNYEPLFIGEVPIDNYFDQIYHEGVAQVVYFNGLQNQSNKNLNETNYQPYANKAKHVQIETQKAALHLIKKYVDLTGIKNVCVVGGYALNVVANNYYLKKLPDVNFYFEPTADDTGVSIGAAMITHREIKESWATPINNNFYHYYNFDEKIDCGKNASAQEVCELLLQQKSVAIFEGAPEAGPRALGHRSILFDPRNNNAKEIVNRIKKREWYRPFAGSILESKFQEYFETLGASCSPYMTINFDAKENAKKLVPGIIHVDGTCRIQTVDHEVGFIYDLLNLFYEKTGCPMLLNTSFNLAEEPLVQTKADAIKTFENSELDAIYFVDDQRLIVK